MLTLQEIYDEWFKYAHRYCLFVLGKKDNDAEDIALEIIYQAYEKQDQLINQDYFPGWMKTLVRNKLLHILRRRNKIALISLSSYDEDYEGGYSLILPGASTKDLLPKDFISALSRKDNYSLEKEELKINVNEAIMSIGDNQRTVITEHHLMENEVKDIAKKYSLPEGTVKSRLNRGRTKMMRKLNYLVD